MGFIAKEWRGTESEERADFLFLLCKSSFGFFELFTSYQALSCGWPRTDPQRVSDHEWQPCKELTLFQLEKYLITQLMANKGKHR